MRLLPAPFLAVLLAALLPVALAQEGQNSTAMFAALPACSIPCLIGAIHRSECSPFNVTCICSDSKLQGEATACILESCTTKEALFAKNETATMCHAPIRDQRQELNTITTVLGVVSGVVVILRIVSRLLVVQGDVGWDDWFIVATFLVGIPNTVLIELGAVANGLGLDVWTLPAETITTFGQYFYVVEILYFAIVAILKMSLLFFYLRIFPTKGVRRLLWATVCFNAAFGVAFVLVGALQCMPVEYFWTKWDGEHEGRCVDINALGWTNAAISIALDIWMLALPLAQLRGLNLHWKKKVGVAMMFCVGTAVTVMSILRLKSLVTFANSVNPTWDNWDVTLWSVLEINVGIICACMPSLRLLLVRIFPRLGGSAGYYASGGRAASSGNPYGRSGNGAVSGGSRAVTASKANAKSQSRSRSLSDSNSDAQLKPARGDAAVFNFDSSAHRGSATTDKLEAEARRRGGGIAYERSYEVSYDDRDQDEERLVHMSDLDPRGVAVRHGKELGSKASKGSVDGSIVEVYPGR